MFQVALTRKTIEVKTTLVVWLFRFTWEVNKMNSELLILDMVFQYIAAAKFYNHQTQKYKVPKYAKYNALRIAQSVRMTRQSIEKAIEWIELFHVYAK